MPMTCTSCVRPRSIWLSPRGFSLAMTQQTLLEPTSSTVTMPERRCRGVLLTAEPAHMLFPGFFLAAFACSVERRRRGAPPPPASA